MLSYQKNDNPFSSPVLSPKSINSPSHCYYQPSPSHTSPNTYHVITYVLPLPSSIPSISFLNSLPMP